MKTRIHGQEGQTLLEAVRGSDHHVRTPCAGRGVCGKCRVIVIGDGPADNLAPPDAEELRHLRPGEREKGIRLACLARFVRTGHHELELGDDGIAVPVEHLPVSFDPEIRMAAGLSGRPLRVAVDIGTTTLAVCLADAAAGTVLSVRTAANAQKSWGSDVVARIQAVVDDSAALAAMHLTIIRQIEGLIREQLAEQGRSPDELDCIALAGNTVMLHLAAGEDPSGMARVPFHPVFLESRTMPAPGCGFGLSAECSVILVPGISAFVGGDITAGVLSTGLDRAEVLELLLDIGTNGEMVLGNRQGMSATATAAGPAFEGAQIAHGCPGLPGALDHAGHNGDGFWYTTINDAPLIGICGSGLLDLAAALRHSGRLDETGFLELPEDAEEFFPDPDSPVSLSQVDIRQLQLAKGAIAAGVQILCLRAGITPDQISRVHLAGGFGTFMSPQAALTIGLLPVGLRGKIVPAGNTSLKGALEVISRTGALERASAIAQAVKTVDLSTDPEFQMAFGEAMLFPEEAGDAVH